MSDCPSCYYLSVSVGRECSGNLRRVIRLPNVATKVGMGLGELSGRLIHEGKSCKVNRYDLLTV